MPSKNGALGRPEESGTFFVRRVRSAVAGSVTETEPGLRGDTASGGGNKPATLETGATIQVPLFVNIGDRVKVQTETGAYISRA